MVFIDGVKHACATCIKGHRSTSCQHSDRQLFAIKRKGRPITQCSHCRELRKTQKVHVKCNCNEKKQEKLNLSQTRGLTQIPGDQDPTEYDEYQPFSGDKTSVGALLNPCQCLTGAKCICCRPSEQASPDIQYPCHDNFIDNEFATSNTTDVSFTNNINNNNSAQSQIYELPPIQIHGYDDRKGKDTSPFIPLKSYHNNSKECSSHSEHIDTQNDSYANSSYSNINSQTLQERPYNHMETEYTSPHYYKDNADRFHDQSEILGVEICRSTSDDLANMIYDQFKFKGCSSSTVNGSCCGVNSSKTMSVCRCGSGCKCQGCDIHATRVDIGTSYNNITFQQNQPSSSCCSSSHETIQPKHTVVKDSDGVLLCGCGCHKLNTDCNDCLGNLCEEYLINQS